MPVADLRGKHIVVTRPAHQAKTLCGLIERHAGHAIGFPVLDIIPKIDTEFTKLIEHLNQYHIALFISPNAVNLAIPAITTVGGLPQGIQIGAVGKATAAALSALNYPVTIYPDDKFDSESLLALPVLQAVQGKRIIIFRGEGGRELLADTLRQRGALVHYAQCYQRRKPDIDAQPLLDRWAQHKLDIIIITSVEGMVNLMELVGDAGRESLLTTPLLVVSERMVARARQLGFKSSIVSAAKASDQDILDALQNWAHQQQNQ